MLDVRRMRVLREVAARGSFSAAAEALAYTQSAVSQQIAALEREAGTVLVERMSRGVKLTDAGRALVVHADVILARLADAEAELDAIAGLRGGRLRLTTFATAGATADPVKDYLKQIGKVALLNAAGRTAGGLRQHGRRRQGQEGRAERAKACSRHR